MAEATRTLNLVLKSDATAAIAGVSKLESKIVDAQDAQNKWTMNADQMARKANGIFDQTRTPIEKYEAQLNELSEMLERGAIDEDTFNRAIEKATNALTAQGTATDEFGQRAKQVFESVKTAAERYEDELKNLDELLKAGAISEDVFNRAVKKATDSLEQQTKAADTMGRRGEQIFTAVRTATERYNDELKELNALLKSGAINQETFNRAAEQAGQRRVTAKDATFTDIRQGDASLADKAGAIGAKLRPLAVGAVAFGAAIEISGRMAQGLADNFTKVTQKAKEAKLSSTEMHVELAKGLPVVGTFVSGFESMIFALYDYRAAWAEADGYSKEYVNSLKSSQTLLKEAQERDARHTKAFALMANQKEYNKELEKELARLSERNEYNQRRLDSEAKYLATLEKIKKTEEETRKLGGNQGDQANDARATALAIKQQEERIIAEEEAKEAAAKAHEEKKKQSNETISFLTGQARAWGFNAKNIQWVQDETQKLKDKEKEQREAAKAVFEGTYTDAEKAASEMMKIDQLLKDNLITQSTYDKAAKKIRDGLTATASAPQAAGTVLAGSAEMYRARFVEPQLKKQQNEEKKIMLEQLDVAKQQLEETKKARENSINLPY